MKYFEIYINGWMIEDKAFYDLCTCMCINIKNRTLWDLYICMTDNRWSAYRAIQVD